RLANRRLFLMIESLMFTRRSGRSSYFLVNADPDEPSASDLLDVQRLYELPSALQRIFMSRRAFPVLCATLRTASATASCGRGSKADGMMLCSRNKLGLITRARARAASIFMRSVISRARASRAPRKIPGNTRSLLIWLGYSE